MAKRVTPGRSPASWTISSARRFAAHHPGRAHRLVGRDQPRRAPRPRRARLGQAARAEDIRLDRGTGIGLDQRNMLERGGMEDGVDGPLAQDRIQCARGRRPRRGGARPALCRRSAGGPCRACRAPLRTAPAGSAGRGGRREAGDRAPPRCCRPLGHQTVRPAGKRVCVCRSVRIDRAAIQEAVGRQWQQPAPGLRQKLVSEGSASTSGPSGARRGRSRLVARPRGRAFARMMRSTSWRCISVGRSAGG